jgi:hypothetical protein
VVTLPVSRAPGSSHSHALERNGDTIRIHKSAFRGAVGDVQGDEPRRRTAFPIGSKPGPKGTTEAGRDLRIQRTKEAQ